LEKKALPKGVMQKCSADQGSTIKNVNSAGYKNGANLHRDANLHRGHAGHARRSRPAVCKAASLLNAIYLR